MRWSKRSCDMMESIVKEEKHRGRVCGPRPQIDLLAGVCASDDAEQEQNQRDYCYQRDYDLEERLDTGVDGCERGCRYCRQRGRNRERCYVDCDCQEDDDDDDFEAFGEGR